MFLKKPHLFTVYLVLMILVFGYLSLALWFPFIYIRLSYEDLYGEWWQTYLFFTAFLFSITLASKPLPYRWFFLILSLACLYTVLEEISWGQRLLGFESPYLFEQYNLQQETNIHNFLTGPFHTTTKNLVEFLLVVALISYGVIYPLLVNKRWPIALWFEQKGIAPPPAYLWPFFLLAAPLELGLFHFNEAEVAELLIGFALVVFTMHYWFAAKNQRDSYPQIHWDASNSRLFTKYLLAVFSVVVLASLFTTQALLQSPEARARIENRILNGTEKFARRFENRGQWDKAAEFYHKVYEADPTRTGVLRKLVNSYQALGDVENYRHHYRVLLERSMTPQARRSGSVSVNLSLAHSYQTIGDKTLSAHYLQRAYDVAAQAVEHHPNHADSVYDLARVEELRGHLSEALAHYRGCAELAPVSEVCAAAYRRLRQRQGRTLDAVSAGDGE